MTDQTGAPNPDVSEGMATARRTLGVTVVLLLAATACTCLIVRAVAPSIDQGASRPASTIASLPLMAATPGPTALMMGTSFVMMGIAPEQVDAELARLGRPLTSFNLGFDMFTPTLFREVAKHVRVAFERAGRKTEFALVEFGPIISTRARRDCMATAETELKMAVAATPRGLLQWLIESPAAGFRALLFRYGFGGANTDGIVGWLADRLLSPPRWWPEPAAVPPTDEQRKIAEARASFRAELHALRPLGEAWSTETRGFQQFLYPQTRDAYTFLLRHVWMTPRELNGELQERRACSDFDNMFFDERWLEDYVETLRLMKTISRHTVLMVPPRNRWVADPTPAGVARITEAADFIARNAGVPVLDLSTTPEITADDFRDMIHVNELTGVPKIATLIAHAIAEQLPSGTRAED